MDTASPRQETKQDQTCQGKNWKMCQNSLLSTGLQYSLHLIPGRAFAEKCSTSMC